jgi:transmembrane sensor
MISKEYYLERLIVKFTSGTATLQEMLELSEWIQKDDDNRQEYYRIRNIIDAVNPAFNPDTIDVEKGRQIFIEHISPKRFKIRKILLWRSVAAIFIVSIISTAIFFNYKKGDKNINGFTQQQVATEPGTFSKINLPDGSKVWLNAASRLTFPKRFEIGERHVSLIGEAYFEVESDLKRPFIVHTADVEVRATGTTFNVKTDLNNQNTSVTLINGKVVLLIGPDKKRVVMRPSQQVVYNNLNAHVQLENADASKAVAWKEGVFTFRNDSLEEIFSQLMKTYNVEIIIKDPELKSYSFHATFKEESLDEILALIKLSTPIIYKETHQIGSSSDQNKRIIEVYMFKP